MNKLYWIIGAASLFAAGGAQAQGYYPGPYLPAPAYAYYGQSYSDAGCGDRFTIVGAHAGVTVLGIDVGGAASASVGGSCDHGRDYVPQSYAPAPPPQPYYQQPEYQPPVYQQPQYQQPQYQPQYQPPAYYPQRQPMYAQPCGCERPQGW